MNEEYYGEEEQPFRKPVEDRRFPIESQEQLGQDILRTFARTTGPNMVEFKKIRRKVPVLVKKIVKNKAGDDEEVEVIDRWEEQEWEIPIEIQPMYPELITDDLSRAFLDENDLAIYRDFFSVCKLWKSFAMRWEVDLSIHYQTIRDDAMALITSSGAYKGQRVKLAKSNIAEMVQRSTMVQEMAQRQQKKKKSFLGLF